MKFSARKKNKDLMRLLLTYKDFQKDVGLVRRKFGIPPKGFAIGPDYDAWIAKLAVENAHGGDTLKRFAGLLGALVRRYRLPQNFSEHVKRYVLFNTESSPLNNYDVGPFPAEVPPDDTPYIPVKVYAQLTDDEVVDLKKEVNRLAKHLPKFQPLKKDVERKLTNERKIAERDEANRVIANANEGRPSKGKKDRPFTLKEIASGKSKRVYQDIRELKELRKRRFGK